MFACLADDVSKMEENTDQHPNVQSLDIKNMKINIKAALKPNIARLVEEDNADDLEEFLLSERNLETSVPSSKKGKKNKSKRNSSKETDEFSKLARRIFHYTCAIDSVNCCKLLLDSEKFTPVNVDAIDEVDERSGLHIASAYHNHKSVDLLLKKGANSFLLNRHSMMPLEEALLSPGLDVDWDISTDASEIVKRIGEKDLKVLKTLGIKCNSKDTLVGLAFKLAEGLALVPLVSLLHARRSIVNTLIKSSEFGLESGGTLVDYMLDKVLSSSLANNMDEKSQKLAKYQTISSVENGMTEVMSSKRILGAWDDDNPEIKFRKDATKGEEINSKYCTNISEPDAGQKIGCIAIESDKISGKCRGNNDVQTRNNRLARKILECILQFVQSWSAHAKSCLPPLIQAVQANDIELINVLLAASAPVNATDNDGNTALHWALKQCISLNGCGVNCRVVEKLLDAGAPVTSGNNTGATPVHTAAGHGHLEALFLIIKKHGGTVNILTGTKETPLHYAVKNNHLPCAALLLRYGANRDVVSLRNQKPIQLARSSEMRTLLSFDGRDLLERMCDGIIASQKCIPCAQKSCGTDSSSPDAPSSKHSVSALQPATSAGSNSSLLLARAKPQSLAEVPDYCQALPSSQLSAFNSQESEQVTNSTWQTVLKKSRKHTISSDTVPIAKEQPPAKTVTLPPYKSVLCRFFGTNKKCEWGINCHFAHSEEELRKGQQVMTHCQKAETGSQVGFTTSDCPKNYKIKLCMHYEKNGTCPNGSKCKFAHGQKELRPVSAWPSVMSGAKIVTRPSTASSLASFSSEELDDMNSRKVFVGGLPPYVKNSELQDFMEEEFGKVVDSTVIYGNDEDGLIRSRGFGFVLFENQKDADEAVRRHYIPFQGKKVELKKAMSRMELASGDELGKQSSSCLGISLPVTNQFPAFPSPSGIVILDDKLRSGSDVASYSQCLSQSSLSVEQQPEFIQNDLQCFADNPAGYLIENSKLIQQNAQMEDIQNNQAIFSSVHSNSSMENFACYGSNKVHPLSHDSDQLLKLDDTLSSSSFHSYGLCSSPSLNTLPSSSLSGICATSFLNSNVNPSNGQPFTYFSSSTSNSYFSTVPEVDGSNQINGRDDEDISQLLGLLEVSPTLEATQSNSLIYKAPVSNSGVSQSVLPVPVQNIWERDALAGYQNLGSQYAYGRSWYGSIQDGIDNELLFSGGLRYPYLAENSGALSNISNGLSGSATTLSNVSNGFCHDGLFPDCFTYDENYRFPVASQGNGIASSWLNDSLLQRFSASELKKNIPKASNGHFQELNGSHVPPTFRTWSSLHNSGL